VIALIADNMQITTAHITDSVPIAELSRDDIEYGLPWSWTPKRIASCVGHEDFNVVVAKDGDLLAGFGIMQYCDNGASLSLLAVSAACRRRAVGTRIVVWLEQVAINAGIFDIIVQLRERNTGAEAFYRQLAFEPLDRVERYYRNSEAALVMSKHLGQSAGLPTTSWQPTR
jgi:ribosomal protein S18 acetylase RimI-like enzyme